MKLQSFVRNLELGDLPMIVRPHLFRQTSPPHDGVRMVCIRPIAFPACPQSAVAPPDDAPPPGPFLKTPVEGAQPSVVKGTADQASQGWASPGWFSQQPLWPLLRLADPTPYRIPKFSSSCGGRWEGGSGDCDWLEATRLNPLRPLPARRVRVPFAFRKTLTATPSP